MPKKMKGEVVKALGKPLAIESVPPRVRSRSDPGQDRGLRRLPYRFARCRGRLASEAEAFLCPTTASASSQR